MLSVVSTEAASAVFLPAQVKRALGGMNCSFAPGSGAGLPDFRRDSRTTYQISRPIRLAGEGTR
ncbi:MAG: hypothetical protein ACOY90_21275 [Candidatus Zhuqueibacterota bacterium]